VILVLQTCELKEDHGKLKQNAKYGVHEGSPVGRRGSMVGRICGKVSFKSGMEVRGRDGVMVVAADERG